MKCVNCGSEILDVFERCPDCGKIQPKRAAAAAVINDERTLICADEAFQGAESRATFEENDVDPFQGSIPVLLEYCGILIYCVLAFSLLSMAENMWQRMIVVLILLAIAIAPNILRKILTRKHAAEWKEQQLLKDRPNEFYMNSEIFITTKLSFDDVIEQIKVSNFILAKTHWMTTHNGTIEFEGCRGMFHAMLSEVNSHNPKRTKLVLNFIDLESDDDDDNSLIKSLLLNKISARNLKRCEIYMNLCATQIEQAVLRAAPNAQITFE